MAYPATYSPWSWCSPGPALNPRSAYMTGPTQCMWCDGDEVLQRLWAGGVGLLAGQGDRGGGQSRVKGALVPPGRRWGRGDVLDD
jgi:hypothetical protein